MVGDREDVYIFHCKSCEYTMSLRAETLGHTFGTPKLRLLDADSVAIACPKCKHVSNYSLLRGSPGYNPQDDVGWGRPHMETVPLEPLRCEVEGCTTPLPLFAMWSATATEEVRKADRSTWQWENLHCPLGHRIKTPPQFFV
jgi:hypothetical protein